MDANKVGKAIAFLRRKKGYTQNKLAEKLGVSDKAVSKWERGLGVPDVSISKTFNNIGYRYRKFA